MMHKKHQPRGLLLLCLVGMLGLGGCGNWNWYPPSAVNQDYGNSVRNDVAQTVLNPKAGLDPSPAAGLAPVAGANTMGNYEKSFKAEEKKPLEMKISY